MRPALCADLALTNPRTPSPPPPPPPPPPCRRRRPGSGASRLEPRRFTRVVFDYLFFSVSRVTPRHQVTMSLHGARSSAAACSLASLWPGPPAAAIFPLAPNAETPTRGARPAVRASVRPCFATGDLPGPGPSCFHAGATFDTKSGALDRRVRLVAGSPTPCCPRLSRQPVAQCIKREHLVHGISDTAYRM
jgi:hypothetical protein